MIFFTNFVHLLDLYIDVKKIKKHIHIYVLYTLKKLKIKEILYHRYNTGKLFVPMNIFVLKNKVKKHYRKGKST